MGLLSGSSFTVYMYKHMHSFKFVRALLPGKEGGGLLSILNQDVTYLQNQLFTWLSCAHKLRSDFVL